MKNWSLKIILFWGLPLCPWCLHHEPRNFIFLFEITLCRWTREKWSYSKLLPSVCIMCRRCVKNPRCLAPRPHQSVWISTPCSVCQVTLMRRRSDGRTSVWRSVTTQTRTQTQTLRTNLNRLHKPTMFWWTQRNAAPMINMVRLKCNHKHI